jgi:hypothetical protein
VDGDQWYGESKGKFELAFIMLLARRQLLQQVERASKMPKCSDRFQVVEQRLRIFQISGVEPFGERAINRA